MEKLFSNEKHPGVFYIMKLIAMGALSIYFDEMKTLFSKQTKKFT